MRHISPLVRNAAGKTARHTLLDELRRPGGLSEMGPHLRNQQGGSLEHVCGGEAQELNTLTEDGVLSPVVADQIVTMPVAVVLDGQSRPFVPEVDTSDPGSVPVADPVLDCRPRTSGLNQSHPEDRLHQRLARRLSQLNDLT